MVELNDKEKEIFKQICLESLNTSGFVSSKTIAKKLHFKYSPATIRNTFVALEKKGFVYKAHFSSGRLPTDFGWRYFVDEFILPAQTWQKAKKISQEKRISTKKLIEQLALISGNLALLFEFLGKNLIFFYQAGISQLLSDKRLEGEAKEIANDLDNLIYNFFDWAIKNNLKEKKPAVFIGKECELLKKGQISLLIDSAENKKKETYLLIIGPKRMSYEKNLALLEGALKTFKEYEER